MRALLAVDPSLTCSGWASFSMTPSGTHVTGSLEAFGVVRPARAKSAVAERLSDIQEQIEALYEQLSLGPGDVVVCEAPTTMRDPRAAILVEQVRGIFEALARRRGVTVPGRIHPRTVHAEVMGLRGRQLRRSEVKAAAVGIVSHLYGAALRALGFEPRAESLSRHQDIVDAILLGHLGCVWLAAAASAELGIAEYFVSQNAPAHRRGGARMIHSRAGRKG